MTECLNLIKVTISRSLITVAPSQLTPLPSHTGTVILRIICAIINTTSTLYGNATGQNSSYTHKRHFFCIHSLSLNCTAALVIGQEACGLCTRVTFCHILSLYSPALSLSSEWRWRLLRRATNDGEDACREEVWDAATLARLVVIRNWSGSSGLLLSGGFAILRVPRMIVWACMPPSCCYRSLNPNKKAIVLLLCTN